MTDVAIIEFGRSRQNQGPVKVTVRFPVYAEELWGASVVHHCWVARNIRISIHVTGDGAVELKLDEQFTPDPKMAAEMYLGQGQWACEPADFNGSLALLTGQVARAQKLVNPFNFTADA
jgi:hypothetical protein